MSYLLRSAHHSAGGPAARCLRRECARTPRAPARDFVPCTPISEWMSGYLDLTEILIINILDYQGTMFIFREKVDGDGASDRSHARPVSLDSSCFTPGGAGRNHAGAVLADAQAQPGRRAKYW